MKVKIKDGLGTRIITEVKRPDPQAVLVIEEEKEYEVTLPELHKIVDLKYVKAENILVDGKKLKSVYPDSIVFVEVPAPAPAPAIRVPEIKKG